MSNRGQGSNHRDLILQAQGSIGRNGWVVGVIAGQILGFVLAATALSFVKVPPSAAVSVLAGTILICGYFGGKIGSRRLRPQPVLDDKPIREHIFEALAYTNKKLGEMIIDEEFNTASSGSGSDRRAMKAQPQLKVAPPAPPKMGGL